MQYQEILNNIYQASSKAMEYRMELNKAINNGEDNAKLQEIADGLSTELQTMSSSIEALNTKLESLPINIKTLADDALTY